MPRRSLRIALFALALIALVAGGAWGWHETRRACCSAPELREPPASRPKLGLMTSLPLYWPAGAQIGDLASGEAEIPWQRKVLEQSYRLVPLDTLSPIPGLAPDAAETDPLAGLQYLAIIQPRGLSPADNVALDQWVRAGGHLLLALDPQLTGDYDTPLGDPRRPTDIALIPPVLPRWGLTSEFDEYQPSEVDFVQLPMGRVPVVIESSIHVVETIGARNGCAVLPNDRRIAKCERVGKGSVTLIGDAAVFEHRELAGEQGAALFALLAFAFP
jgi:hypothetical protein